MHTPPVCLLIRRPLPRRRCRRLRRAAAVALYYAAAVTIGAVLIAALTVLTLAL